MAHIPQFKRNDLILSEDPWVYAVSSDEVDKLCHACLHELPDDANREDPATGTGRSRCSGCRYAHYCSEECQRSDWKKHHKLECPALKKVVSAGLTPSRQSIIALKIFIKITIKTAGGNRQTRTGFREPVDRQNPTHRTYADLMSHSEELLLNKDILAEVARIRAIVIFCMNLTNPKDFPSMELLVEIIGKVKCNSFGIADECMVERSGGVYLNASIFDHSCQPNACRVFEGSRIFIRATEDIARFEDVRISYTDQFMPVDIRQAVLSDGYYFTCQCPRCEDPAKDSEMFALKCGNVLCDAPIPSDNRSTDVCRACGFVPLNCDSRLHQFKKLCHRIEQAEVACEQSTALDLLAEIADVVHPTNPLFAVSVGRLLSAEKHLGRYFCRAAEIYRFWMPFPAVSLVMGWTFFQAGMSGCDGDCQETQKKLSDSERILSALLGFDHPRVRQIRGILSTFQTLGGAEI